MPPDAARILDSPATNSFVPAPAPRCAPPLLSSPSALGVEDVHYAYGAKKVLCGVTFAVPTGSICALFGPNGSGKTTLFRCCLGLLKPERGIISICGKDIRNQNITNLARKIAYVPQEHKPGFPFTVREVVAMGRTPHMQGFFRLRQRDMDAVDQAMDIAGVAEFAGQPCTTLSGGQRQLTALARALAQQAPLMLLDEPTSALDFSNQMVVWQTLRRIAEQGVTVLVCCHDPNHILWFCDTVAVLHQGRIAAAGPSRTTLNAEMLHALYADAIEIRTVDGAPFARPRAV